MVMSYSRLVQSVSLHKYVILLVVGIRCMFTSSTAVQFRFESIRIAEDSVLQIFVKVLCVIMTTTIVDTCTTSLRYYSIVEI